MRYYRIYGYAREEALRMWRWRRKKETMTDPENEETISILADLTNCPHCDESLIGEPIEKSRREMFGNRTHYSKLIGVSNGDRVEYYECPKCRERIERTDVPSTGYRTSHVEVRIGDSSARLGPVKLE